MYHKVQDQISQSAWKKDDYYTLGVWVIAPVEDDNQCRFLHNLVEENQLMYTTRKWLPGNQAISILWMYINTWRLVETE